MSDTHNTRSHLLVGLYLLVGLALAACASPTPKPEIQVREVTVEVERTVVVEKVVRETVIVEATPEPFSQPHPILGDARVRRALALCVDRDALVAAVYPYLDEGVGRALQMDSFLPREHWAYGGPYEDFVRYDPDEAARLLDEAGWTLAQGEPYRLNASGDVLALKLTTTDAQFRQIWAETLEAQFEACGVQLVRQHTPAGWWFGERTGLQRRDFELAAFAWRAQPESDMYARYGCQQIPLPKNGWRGRNYMGWCDSGAEQALRVLRSALMRDQRIAAYKTLQERFVADAVSIPLFQRAEAMAWRSILQNVRANPTELPTANIEMWRRIDDRATVTIGLSQEPASMLTALETSSAARHAAQIGVGALWTEYDYDYQPRILDPLPTLENGLAELNLVKTAAGDRVYSAAGEAVDLEKGVPLLIDGVAKIYDGASEIELPQLTVRYLFKDYVWSDGRPGQAADIRLAYAFECSQAPSPACDAVQDIAFGPGLEAVVTYLPGYQSPTYFLPPWRELYPAHLALADGRLLADAPPETWRDSPELTEARPSIGPFVLREWRKGEMMQFERNPYFQPAPALEKVTLLFTPDADAAIGRLLNGEIDYLDPALIGDLEMARLWDLGSLGEIDVTLLPSPFWEHVDMNLYTK
ncbi:MAG: peptide ABC transporter substrate-binding protein [Chloroflexi bacterium]|nr:peptide ABC transporter substrate-binding protein [Chloroflexota bacterium]